VRYLIQKFWWFILFAVCSVGLSLWAVLAPCPAGWAVTLGEQYLRFGATVVVVGLLAHFVGEALPRRWFHYDRRPYLPWKWERQGRVYDQVLHISRWKDKMLDKSQAVKGSVTKSIGTDVHIAHLESLLAETCVAETVHWVLFCLSPLMFVTMDLPLSIPGAVIYALCNLISLMIQRYNRPRLAALLRLERMREDRKQRTGTP
jgi:glycosyl-4,4'-diaponeurosporenoate acyltransferase